MNYNLKDQPFYFYVCDLKVLLFSYLLCQKVKWAQETILNVVLYKQLA
jgi:hypothetical protein